MTELKEETTKEKILNILKISGWISPAELQSHFSPTEKGGQSFMRYIRDGKGFLKEDGYKIIKRKREHASRTWEYLLVPRELIQEELF